MVEAAAIDEEIPIVTQNTSCINPSCTAGWSSGSAAASEEDRLEKWRLVVKEWWPVC